MPTVPTHVVYVDETMLWQHSLMSDDMIWTYEVHVAWPQAQAINSYPPERLSDFVQGLFLNGQADTAGWHSKLQLFLYALLDRQGGTAGQKIDLASFRYASPQLVDGCMAQPRWLYV